jgi:sec-independent protein translocase protein TatA
LRGGEIQKCLGHKILIIIAVIVIVLFGASRLPAIGKGLGQSIRDFKKSINEPDTIDVTPKKESSKEKDTRDEKE